MTKDAQLLKHQSSSYYDRNKPGCLHGLIQFFQLYYQHNIRRSLALTRHDGGKHDASKQRLNIRLDEEENVFSDQEKTALIADQNQSSSKWGVRFAFSKLSRKKVKKQKTSKSDPSLVHASSDHYMESKDNDFTDEIYLENENSTAGLGSHVKNSDAMIEHVKTPSTGRRESCEAFNISSSNRTDGSVDHILQEQADNLEGLNILEFISEDRSLSLQGFEDPECDRTNNFHDLQDPNAKVGFAKSISFPAPGSPGKTGGLSRLKQNESKVFASRWVKSHDVSNLRMPLMVRSRSSSGFESSLGDYDELRILGDGGNISNHLKDLRLRIKDVTAGNTKEHHRISLDGVLDKIPYGQKLFEDAKENLRYRPTQRSVFGRSKIVGKSIMRSHSLTESLVSYSRLLKSTSFKEPEKLPERLKQEQQDALCDTRAKISWGRIFSNPEFFDSFPPSMNNLASDITSEQYGPTQQAELRMFLHKEDNINLDVSLENKLELHGDVAKGVVQGIDDPLLAGMVGKSKTNEGSDDSEGEGSSRFTDLHDQISGNQQDQHGQAEKSSSISFLDSFQDDHASPSKPSSLEGYKLKSGHDHLHGQNSSEENELDEAESMKDDPKKSQIAASPTEIRDFHVHLDPKDDAAFYFVKDVLKVSGFWGETAQREACPSLSPTLSLEHSYCNVETENGETTWSSEKQMLFDLMNVVLLEIYENCFSIYSAFLHRNAYHVRPLPVGIHVLEEVWAKISWHLGPGKQRITTLEGLMSRDFSKDDEWLDLRRDSETVDLELEDWILDDLLDEVLIHLDEFVSPDCAVG